MNSMLSFMENTLYNYTFQEESEMTYIPIYSYNYFCHFSSLLDLIAAKLDDSLIKTWLYYEAVKRRIYLHLKSLNCKYLKF